MLMAGVTADRCGVGKKKKRKNKKRSWCRLRSTDFIHSIRRFGTRDRVIFTSLKSVEKQTKEPTNTKRR